jgi:DNA topoisomerase-1
MVPRRRQAKISRAALDPPTAARLARLHHVSGETAGISRHKARSGFDYRRPDGSLVRDLETLQRIKSLVIPPAWSAVWISVRGVDQRPRCGSASAVWISPDAFGHIQVTGRDQRGRKQYRYHPRWREVRDESKYGKMLIFARVRAIDPRKGRRRSPAPRSAMRACARGDCPAFAINSLSDWQ